MKDQEAPATTGFMTSSSFNPLRRLDTPIKRFGFVVLCVGATLSAPSLINVASYLSADQFFMRWYEVLIGEDYGNYSALRWGSRTMIAGMLLSFLYDRTIGKIASWIRHGKM